MDNFYWEDKKILNVEDVEDDYKKITFELTNYKENADGSKDVAETIVVPEWELRVVSTTEPSDSSEARNSRGNYIVEKLFEILNDHNIRTDEISFIIQKLIGKLKGEEENAILNNFGVTRSEDVRLWNWTKK